MMRRTIVRVALVVAGTVLVMSACGGGSLVNDGAATAESVASTDASSATSATESVASDTVATDGPSTSSTSSSSSSSSDGAATSTGGEQPTFTWEPVDGATLYSVVVTTADGTAFWAWQGSETTATVGDGAPDPLVSADMMWSVVALSDAGDGLWESGLLPV